MSATKYQILYRYVNEATSNAITNSSNSSYDETCEFFTKYHKLMSGNDSEKLVAEDDREILITEGNNPSNVKNDMLFAYTGTKKIKHKKFISATSGSGRTSTSDGYIIAHWDRLNRNDIGNRGDYSKKYTTLYAPTPEDGGVVVTNPTVYVPSLTETGGTDGSLLNITVIDGNMSTIYGNYFTSDYLMSLIKKECLFELSDNTPNNYCYNPTATGKRLTQGTVYHNASGWYSSNPLTNFWLSDKNFGIDKAPTTVDTWSDAASGSSTSTSAINGSVYGYSSNTDVYTTVKFKEAQIARVTIPEHYEEESTYPYLIKDTYERIQLSPWFVNCTCSSLEAAIEKARILVSMIGLENVKVVKLVEFDQFLKIK